MGYIKKQGGKLLGYKDDFWSKKWRQRSCRAFAVELARSCGGTVLKILFKFKEIKIRIFDF